MDARPSLAGALSSFGSPVTVTRPVPDDTPIVTTGIWMPPSRRTASDEVYETGTELTRGDPERKVMALPKSALPTVPLGTIVAAPEENGGPVLDWRVDGIERLEADHTRVVVVPV